MESVKNRNIFVVTCISCIIFLLFMCYFGIGNSLKGTNARLQCLDGYRNYEFNGSEYCVNQFESIFGQGVNVQLRNQQGQNFCIAMNIPMANISSHEDACKKLGSGWSTYLECAATDDTCMCKSEDIYACVPSSYNILYNYSGGYSKETMPSSAKENEVIMIPNPSRLFTINGVDVEYGAVVGEETKINLEFDGWVFDGDVNYAMFGHSKDDVNYAWSSHDLKVKATYFKNLSTIGNNVTLSARWSLPDKKVKLPTLEKEGYECLWYSNPSNIDTDDGYTPGSTVELSFLDLAGGYLNLYAGCKKTYDPTVSVTVNALDGYIDLIDGVSNLDLKLKTYEQTCNVYIDQPECSVSKNVTAQLDGYDFLGWTTKTNNCANPQELTEFFIVGDVELIACYKKNPSYSSSKPSSSAPSSSIRPSSSSVIPSSSVPSSSSIITSSSNMDNLGNVNDNSDTGDIAIFIMLIIGLATLVYSVYYFKTIMKS